VRRIAERAGDEELLARARRVTRPGGLLVVANTVSRDFLVARSICGSPRQLYSDIGDYVLVEHPSFDAVNSILHNRWVYYRKDNGNLVLAGEFSFTLRIYTPTELKEIAENVGWRFLEAYNRLHDLAPYRPGEGSLNMVFENPS